MTTPSSSAAAAAAGGSGRPKHTIYHGHRRPSPHRPVVRGGLFTHRGAMESPNPRPPKPTSPPSPISFRDWDPSTSTPSSPPPSTVPASARRLSPLARFVLDALRRHGRWGPAVLAELSKLRRVGPDLVEEVLRSKPPPKPPVALPFFLWAGRQKGYRHTFAGFHALAAVLSSSGLPSAADQLPDLMRAHGKPVSHPQLSLLVRLHTSAYRPLRALHILRRFRQDFSVQPDIHTYNRVIDSLANAGHLDHALQLFDEMPESNVKPLPITFTILARALARGGKTEQLLVILGRMRVEACRPDVFVYTAIVKAMVERGYMEGCVRVWEEFRRDGVEADAMAYATMVAGLCNAGMVAKASELFEEMRRKKVLVDRTVYASLVDGYVADGKVGDGCRVLKEMVDAGYRADLGIYNSLIGGLCGIGREDKAHKMFQIVLQEELVPSSETVLPLLACYADGGKMNKFFQLVNKLAELGLSVIDLVTDFFKFFLLKDGRELKAMEVFEALKRKGHCSLGIYNILIEYLLRIKERKKSISLFEEMQGSEDLKPDSCTYSHMIPCFVDEGNIEEASLCYNSMMKVAWIPSISAYCALVKGLCKVGEVTAAISLVKDCLGNIENGPMEFKYTLTILDACKSKCPEKVIKVLDEMIELGYPVEEIIYCAIIHGFCKYASSTEARKVFTVFRDRNLLSEAKFIVYEDILNEHMKKVTAGLVASALKFFDLDQN